MSYTNEAFRLDDVVAAVEADSFAYHMLWKEWSNEVPQQWRELVDSRKRVTWKQQGIGTMETLAYLDVGQEHGGRMPICVSLSWAEIDGHRVLFYDQCSMVTHSDLVRKWLDKNLPDNYVHTDANNFHIIIHHIRRLMEDQNG